MMSFQIDIFCLLLIQRSKVHVQSIMMPLHNKISQTELYCIKIMSRTQIRKGGTIIVVESHNDPTSVYNTP